MPPSSNDKPSASTVQEAHSVTELFERRIEWAERFAAHHGGAHHQEAGASGVPHESLIAIVGGVAAAAGQETLTTGLVQNLAADRGGYSIAVGEAIFEASAQSPGPGGAGAAANTFLTVLGADFIIEYESNHGGRGLNNAWASSELDYVALDIKGWSPRAGPLVIELHQPGHHFQPWGHQPPDGNYADVIATADSHGAHSLSATLTNALTVENQFSFVNAIAVVAV
jgi:hypothetical protein